MQREEPYQDLTCQESFRNGRVPVKELGHRWCMAVVSSCREQKPRGFTEKSVMKKSAHNGEA